MRLTREEIFKGGGQAALDHLSKLIHNVLPPDVYMTDEERKTYMIAIQQVHYLIRDMKIMIASLEYGK
jgi:hypothetical protein